jgi:hypothetical protein
VLRDTLGNSGSFGPPAGFPKTVSVTAPTAPSADTAPPQLVAFGFTPKTVDISADPAEVTVTARVTDATGALNPTILGCQMRRPYGGR